MAVVQDRTVANPKPRLEDGEEQLRQHFGRRRRRRRRRRRKKMLNFRDKQEGTSRITMPNSAQAPLLLDKLPHTILEVVTSYTLC